MRKAIKKIIALSAVSCMIFSISACGIPKEKTETKDETSEISSEDTSQNETSNNETSAISELEVSSVSSVENDSNTEVVSGSDNAASSVSAESEESGETPAEENNENTIEISGYFEDYEPLVSSLGMELTEPWQMSDDSYVKDGYYLEFDPEYGIASMRNDGNSAVVLYGCKVGDNVDSFDTALLGDNWKRLDANSKGTYVKKASGETIFWISLTCDESGTVTSWYWNNWPEGDWDRSVLDE